MKSKLKFLIIISLLLGIFFRFSNLDKKFYWYDEAFTSLRVSGYKQAEVIRQVTSQESINAKDLLKYQQVNSEKTLADTIQGLAIEEPQLPPFYFLIARFWTQLFGSSPTAVRTLSAIASVLAFPCLYWLCRELFEAPEVAWVAMGLFAVSPFHILYAQEARPYSLWTVAILLACAALLRAVRLQTAQSWLIYAITIVLGLYTHLFTALVAIGHGIYILILSRFRLTKTVVAYGLASIAALVAFLPWIATLMANKVAAQSATNWSELGANRIALIKNWMGNLGRLFFDFGLVSESPKIYLIPFTLATLILFILLVYALYSLVKQTPQRVWLFLIILIGLTALAVMMPDFLFGGIRSTKGRYLLPTYLGIEITLAYLLATKGMEIADFSGTAKPWSPLPWKIVTVLLLTSGIISATVSSPAENWWNKEWGKQNPQIAHTLNQTQNPRVLSDVSDVTVGNLLSLGRLLDSTIKMQIVVLNPAVRKRVDLPLETTLPKLSNDVSQVFIYGFSKELRSKLEEAQQARFEPAIKPTGEEPWLWKLVKS